MSSVIAPLTAVAAVTAGIVAGLFFVFSVVIMPALARIPGSAGIAAMQAINIVIIRALFLVVFLGTAVATVALALLAPDPLHLLAAAAYVIGVIGVTAAVNVPLNNALDAVAADSVDGERLWRHYLTRWTAWNHVRTVTSTVAMAALVLAG